MRSRTQNRDLAYPLVFTGGLVAAVAAIAALVGVIVH